MSQVRQKKRRRAPELVHGLTERVDLKDWEFALIIAALKVYADDAKRRGLSPGVITYARRLRSHLSVPFAKLIKRTKRTHFQIWSRIQHSKNLTDFYNDQASKPREEEESPPSPKT